MSKLVKDPVAANDIDTVVVLCMAVLQKSEYDEMQVQNIRPAEVVSPGQHVKIPPVLLVGPSRQVREQTVQKFFQLFATYQELLDRARSKGDSHDR